MVPNDLQTMSSVSANMSTAHTPIARTYLSRWLVLRRRFDGTRKRKNTPAPQQAAAHGARKRATTNHPQWFDIAVLTGTTPIDCQNAFYIDNDATMNDINEFNYI